jgi:hypothetical protein
MEERTYFRDEAILYAQRWALDRNPRYLDFSQLGGDCTNFASQCLYAGAKVMNETKDTGWYYHSATDRAAAWTSVEYFRKFLLGNAGQGPYAVETPVAKLDPGDFVQLNNGARFYHTLLVMAFDGNMPLLAAHTYDALLKPLGAYTFAFASGLHIAGVRAMDA